MKKYQIRTNFGTMDALYPIPAKITSPRWMSRLRLFTHETPKLGMKAEYALSEASTGMWIACGFKTRREATAVGKQRMIEAGIQKTLSAIRENRMTK